jgi:hypothetical protein
MATYTKRLTAAPQSRKKHSVYRNGRLVRVYYTDSGKDTGGGTKTIKNGSKPFKGNTWAPTQAMINEFRNYGRDFIQQKYKLSTSKLNYMAKAINTAIAGKTGPVAQQGFVAQAGRFADGGPAMLNANDNAAFKRKMTLNLENDEDKAQGYQHEWAQPTSISSLITSQLRQSQQAPADYFEAWAQTNGGKVNLLARDSSSFGVDAQFVPNDTPPMAEAEQETISPYGKQMIQAEADPMGAFGTTMVMDPFYGDQEASGGDEHDHGLEPGQGADGLINPWSEGYGGANNSYGPSSQTMAQATMEAMALANAYFAPQRMELAYQLGDMETDMRRLAVNLGRQVDDPVLQAKLYKEGMRAVRTMDIQQNTMAFQMSDQRRREELQNFQFYDQLAQNEYQLRLQDEQWRQDYDLRENQYKLQYKQLEMMNDAANPPEMNSSDLPGTQDSAFGDSTIKPPTTPAKPTIKAPDTAGNLLDPKIYY